VLSENKGKVLLILYLTQESKMLYHGQEVMTAANMHHRCCYCNIVNVAFAQENMNEMFEAIKN